MSRINSLKSAGSSYVQWTGDYKPAYKLAPEISLDSNEEVTSTIQLVSTANTAHEIQELLARSSAAVIEEPTTVQNYTNIRVKVQPRRLAEIARMSTVVWIEPWTEPVLHDEKQGLIVAGQLTGSEPASSYLTWLQSKGITSAPDFLVDVADTGIDQGILDPEVLHKDFLSTSSLSRIGYARYVGAFDEDAVPQDYLGHGTINASIVGGYNVDTVFPYVDGDGYKFGLGIHPYARLGVTQIFAPAYTNPSFPVMLNKMYADGARISSNSWGTYNNSYTVDCQMYDSLVRDAQESVQGNQEMTIVFSSGNKGAGGNLTSPGSAKNTILVGASESLRAGFDGCGIDTTGADDINSLIGFSSGGPTADGRRNQTSARPELIQERVSVARLQCSGVVARKHPTGQSMYTWSSGTATQLRQ
jgi:hypothetical protein